MVGLLPGGCFPVWVAGTREGTAFKWVAKIEKSGEKTREKFESH